MVPSRYLVLCVGVGVGPDIVEYNTLAAVEIYLHAHVCV